MSLQRLIIAFLITIGLLSSTTGAAFSQGRMVGSQSITICSPDGSHDIILGANGEPVLGGHECDDCNFSSLDLQEVPELAASGSQDLSQISSLAAADLCLNRLVSTTQARAPPFVV